MTDESSLRQGGKGLDRPATRNANPARAASETPAQRKVELAVELLEKLRCVQTELERHVRVYLEAGERLVRCTDLLETLLHKSLSEHEWRTVKRDLDRTRPLSGTAALRQADEELALIAKEFDGERDLANEEMRRALDPTQRQGADLAAIQNAVFTKVWNMSVAAGRLTENCRDGADDWLNQIREALSALFGRIDEQLAARETMGAEAFAPRADWKPDAPVTNMGSTPAPVSEQPQRGLLGSLLKGGS